MYATLFLGLPVLGVWLFARLCKQMAADDVPSRPVIALFFVFAAYGAVLLFAVSSALGVWSGMHSITMVGLVFVGVPWLVVQGISLYPRRSLSPYHEAAAALSLGFPLVLGALFGLVFALGGR
jgi:hypothetical protein